MRRSSRRRLDVQGPNVDEANETSEAEARDGQEHPLMLACRAGCATALGLVKSLYTRVSHPIRQRGLQYVCLGGRQRPCSRDGTCGRIGVLLHSWVVCFQWRIITVPKPRAIDAATHHTCASCGQGRNLVRTMPQSITRVLRADTAATLKILVRTPPETTTLFQPHAWQPP